jgi:hypothetical protein
MHLHKMQAKEYGCDLRRVSYKERQKGFNQMVMALIDAISAVLL